MANVQNRAVVKRVEAQSSDKLADAHRAFTKRKSLRLIISKVLAAFVAMFFLYQVFTTANSILPHFVMGGFALALIVGINFLIASQDPDPDPAATARELESDRKAAAIQAEMKAANKAVYDERRRQEREEENARRKEEAKQRAEEQKELLKQAAENMIAMDRQQMVVERENRITELLILADTDVKKAIKLATKEGIDLHAEAQRRIANGAASVGFAMGVGAQAGVELVREVVRRNGESNKQ